MDVPPRLYVPCATRPPFAGIRVKPAGTYCRAGESLLDSGTESGHVPVAPVAGAIVETGRINLTNLRQVPAVMIDTTAHPDGIGEAEAAPDETPPPAAAERVAAMLSRLKKEDFGAWIDRLRYAGVWADRWTSPDLLGQLHQCLRRPVDTVVCSMLDADPSHGVNRAMAEAYGTEVVAAIAAFARLTGAERVWAVVDAADPPARWEGIRNAAAAMGANELRIVPLANDYPQADPTLLVYTLTRRKLRPGSGGGVGLHLPTEHGVLLLDAAAAVAAGRALLAGDATGEATQGAIQRVLYGAARGVMHRVPFTVYDQPRDHTHMLTVPVGAPLRDVLDAVGLADAHLELRAGGPLREMSLTGDHIVAGGELNVYACPHEPEVNPEPCIRCAWCMEGCPVRIHPAGILEAAQHRDLNWARGYGIDACIECGICSYVCPSRLPLLQAVRIMRRAKPDKGQEAVEV
jgi:electron transport complex protein RnfC